MSASRFRTLLASLVLIAAPVFAQAADIYGYVDAQGVAHFAAAKLDARYQLFFKGGQQFDTADGIAPLGIARAPKGANGGSVTPAAQTLLAMFEASPNYKAAKAALRDAARTHSIDYELLQALVATESGFDAQAVSPKGALGLMQLMPGTAERYGVRGDKRKTQEAKLFDPRINITAGARYFDDLIDMFEGRIELALAAYNAGEGAVQRAGNQIPAFKETQNYVRTVLGLYAQLKPPAPVLARRAAPGRVRMELSGGAVNRGNLPPTSVAQTPGTPPTLNQETVVPNE